MLPLKPVLKDLVHCRGSGIEVLQILCAEVVRFPGSPLADKALQLRWQRRRSG
jgi:hypothetical protein